MIVGGFCGAIVGLLQTLADPMVKLPSIVYWLLGSFAGATYEKVTIAAAVTLAAGTLLMALRWHINLLSLGEDDANALGVNVELLRRGFMGLVALLAAAQVSVSGGRVGLIVPHLARMLAGPEHTMLLPAAAFLGGIYLLVMHDIATKRNRTGNPDRHPRRVRVFVGMVPRTIAGFSTHRSSTTIGRLII